MNLDLKSKTDASAIIEITSADQVITDQQASWEIRAPDVNSKNLRIVFTKGITRMERRGLIDAFQDQIYLILQKVIKNKDPKKQLDMHPLLKGKSRQYKNQIIKRLELVDHYIKSGEKDLNVLAKLFNSHKTTVDKIISIYLSKGVEPLLDMNYRPKKLKGNAAIFAQDYFLTEENQYNSLDDLRNELMKRFGDQFSKVGRWTIKTQLGKANIKFKTIFDLSKKKKETDESEDEIFKKFRHLNHALSQN